MSRFPIESIDVNDLPELRQLAEKVRATARPVLLRRGGQVLVLVAPVELPVTAEVREQDESTRAIRPRRLRRFTDEDLAAFQSAAGAWANVDTDKLIVEIYAARLGTHTARWSRSRF